MTTVPGAGFAALLAIMAVLVVLPILAGVSLLVARATGLRIEWGFLALYVVGIVSDASWRRGVRHVTAGYAIGGAVGALAGLVFIGQVEAVAAAAVLTAPAALRALALERATMRSGRFLRGLTTVT